MRVYACNCDMNDTVQGWDFVAYVNRTKAKKHTNTHTRNTNVWLNDRIANDIHDLYFIPGSIHTTSNPDWLWFPSLSNVVLSLRWFVPIQTSTCIFPTRRVIAGKYSILFRSRSIANIVWRLLWLLLVLFGLARFGCASIVRCVCVCVCILLPESSAFVFVYLRLCVCVYSLHAQSASYCFHHATRSIRLIK